MSNASRVVEISEASERISRISALEDAASGCLKTETRSPSFVTAVPASPSWDM